MALPSSGSIDRSGTLARTACPTVVPAGNGSAGLTGVVSTSIEPAQGAMLGLIRPSAVLPTGSRSVMKFSFSLL